MKTRNLLGALLIATSSFLACNNDPPIEFSQESRPRISELEKRLAPYYARIYVMFGLEEQEQVLILNGKEQEMYLVGRELGWPKIYKTFEISTSRNGFGNIKNSYKTPLGILRVKQIYGKGAPIGTMFHDTYNTGRRVRIYTNCSPRKKSLMTTRVIELEGVEPSNLNTFDRSIYMHGASNEASIGSPNSLGCFRMMNQDMADLADNVLRPGTYVYSLEEI